MSAERRKRAEVLESEAKKESAINVAEGQKESRIRIASAEAQSVVMLAEAEAQRIKIVGEAMSTAEGSEAVNFSIAESYVRAYEKMAKETTTLIMPQNVSDVSSMVSTAIATYAGIHKNPGMGGNGRKAVVGSPVKRSGQSAGKQHNRVSSNDFYRDANSYTTRV